MIAKHIRRVGGGYGADDGGGEMFAVGKYLDRIVIENGEPLLQDRRVVLESRRVDVLLVYPL
jgi:anthranilate 1,2-dioxygenase small subunit